MAPGEVLLAGRNRENDLLVGGHRVYLGTGGAAIHILDLETGKLRDPILQDQYSLAWLTENLENVHFYQCPVVCTDIPKDVLSINSFYAALAGTRKNVQESATTPQAATDIIEMAAMIAGDEEALRERPFISFVTSWMISPLKLDIGTSRVLETVASRGIPVALSSAPVTGSTAPATLAGVLTLVHAEELFGIVLAQIIREGAPVLYGPVPAVANMRNMAYLGGAVETGMMNAAAVQMANHIGVPIYSDAGQTDSKLPDIQAGYEKAANIFQVALASLLAGAAMQQVGLGLIHAMSHQVSGFYDTPHGLTNAKLLASVFAFNLPKIQQEKRANLDSLSEMSFQDILTEIDRGYGLADEVITVCESDLEIMSKRARERTSTLRPIRAIPS